MSAVQQPAESNIRLGSLRWGRPVSAEAAKMKGIVSPVAGQADIFVVPDLEAGNMLGSRQHARKGA